ncbi:MFS transporter [Candidatus Woesearchaeota archaeon]|nr:MFS transporter [Candidatus Woesearchaeota archaeon]
MDKYQHHFDIHHFIHNKYNDFLLSHTIRSFAVSLISLFIPVFLLEKGVGIVSVIAFEMVLFLMLMALHVPSINFIRHVGVKTVLIVSYIISIIFYFYLHQMDAVLKLIGVVPYLIILSLLNAIFGSLFWMSFHVLFVKSTEKSKHRGRKLGLLQAIPTIISIASPLVGGFLITYAGFKLTFLVAASLFIVAIVPLFFSPDTTITEKVNVGNIIRGSSKDMNFVFFFEGTSFIGTAFLWPVLLFLFQIAVSTMGALYFVSKIFYALLSYISGKKADVGHTEKLVATGSTALGFSMILRSFSKIFAIILSASPLTFIAFFQSIGGISGPLFNIPIQSKFYKMTKDYNPLDVIVSRELYMTFGRLLMLGILLFLLTTMTVEFAFITMLVMSGVTTFAFAKYKTQLSA